VLQQRLRVSEVALEAQKTAPVLCTSARQYSTSALAQNNSALTAALTLAAYGNARSPYNNAREVDTSRVDFVLLSAEPSCLCHVWQL
jgi:hypothetical protein